MKSHNKSYESMFNQIKATYFLHILEGQASGFHTLISLLNSYKNLQFLIFWGTRAHILGPRNLTDWNLHEDLYVRSVSNPILFGVSGVAYFIWEEGGGGGGGYDDGMKLGTHWGHDMRSKNRLWIFKMADYFWWSQHNIA